MESNGFTRSSERSSSRISIYNYPEHLNPFTEEDNHKRLRFWKFSKSNDNSKRRSFSIGNLRDVWTFRSFNLKKKSSTLGIQKTSESPPVLRRNLNPADSNGRPIMRSLQNISTPVGMPLDTDPGSPSYHRKAYFDRCSTPQPTRYQTIRSSYSSLSSTNPFESEVESDVNNIESPTVGLRTKAYRKKRRAPEIPTKIKITEPSDSAYEKSMNSSHNMNAEDLDIKSLTSEIERFVHNSNESSDSRLPNLDATLDSETRGTNTVDTRLLIVENPNNHKISSQEQILEVTEVLHETPRNEQISAGTNLSIRESNSNIKTAIPDRASNTEIEKSMEIQSSNKEHLKLEVNLLNIENPDSNKNIEKEISDLREYNNKKMTPPSRKHRSVRIENTVTTITQERLSDTQNDSSVELPTESDMHLTVKDNLSNTGNLVTDVPIQKNTVNAIQFNEPNREHFSADAGSVTCKQIKSDSIDDKANSEAKFNNEKESDASNTKPISEDVRPVVNNYNIATEEHVAIRRESNSPKGDQIEGESPFRRSSNSSTFEARRSYQNNSNRRFDNNIVEASGNSDNPLTIVEKPDSNVDSTEDKSKGAKAKSVKEIIDSINRSQQLLKDSAAKGTNTYSTALYSTNDAIPIVNHNRHKRQNVENDISSGSSLKMKQNEFQKNKIDKIVFQCRESSPTASNLDWNPVPKPKRINSDLTNKDINEL